MVATPIHDVLRGFAFDPSAFNRELFDVTAFFLPLYVPTEGIHLTFGNRLNGPWNLKQQATLLDLVNQMKAASQTLSKLDDSDKLLDAIQGFCRPNERGYSNPHCLESLAYTLIRSGRSAAALNVLNKLETTPAPTNWEKEIRERVNEMKFAVSQSENKAFNQLQIWLDETLHKLGMDSYREGGPR